MPGHVYADRASFLTVENRRRKDLEFLDWVRTATLEELDQKRWETFGVKSFPAWKRAAVARAMARHQGTR